MYSPLFYRANKENTETLRHRVKQSLFYVLFVSLCLCVFLGCKKSSSPSPPPCIAGNGGYNQVVLYANHGSTAMRNYFIHTDTAFVKFNTLVSPDIPTANYDTFYVSDWTMGDHIHCTNLKCGDYYFFRTAFDSIHNVRYTGGIGVTVNPVIEELDTAVNVN